MASNKSNKWFWLIGSLIVIGGGIGVYLLLRRNKVDEEDIIIAEEDIRQEEQSNPTPSIVIPSELDSTEKVKRFQDWMDKYRPLWINDNGKYKNLRVGTKEEPNRHINGIGYGTYGKNTNTAWSVFGKEYIASLSKKSGTGKSLSKNAVSDINTIIGFASGNKAEKNYLQNTNPEFVKAWADSIRRKDSKNAFIWSNQIYRMKTGERLLDYNPLNITHYTKTSGQIFKQEPRNNAGSIYSNEGVSVGKIKGFQYSDGNIWLYFPDKGSSHKWGIAKYFTKNNSSSFDGDNTTFEPNY